MASKIIQKFVEHIAREFHVIGKCVYYAFSNGNRGKIWCSECGVHAEIIHIKNGKVDAAYFPFSDYFEPVQCSQGAPYWTQNLDSNNKWRYEDVYPHVLPKESDYRNLAIAIDNYFNLFEFEKEETV